MTKCLVAYFSASGVTKNLAKNLAEAVGGDVFEIMPETPYTNDDLNWMDKNSRSSVEMMDKNSRPKIKEQLSNMADYNIIFLGFPIWWYVAPTIINTFLESYNFEGKTIVPFATSGGSGMGKTLEVLKPLVPNTVKWTDGTLLSPNTPKEQLKEWVETLNL